MEYHQGYSPRRLRNAVVAMTAALLFSYPVYSAEIQVEGSLQEVLAQSAAGDILRLQNKIYEGPVIINQPLQIIGSENTIIRGNGHGSVMRVRAPNVVIKNLTITASGLSLETQDSGIFLEETATNAIVDSNEVIDNLIGIYVSGAENSIIRNNHITGRRDLRMNERGNGIQIWNAPGALIDKNRIEYGRDGIFVTTSSKNIFRDNRMQNLRFAIHYMYTNHSKVTGNISTGNHIGFALMSSTNLIVEDNLSYKDRDRGFLLNYANKVKMTGNEIAGGTEKCIFIYNSHRNQFIENRLSDCLIGIHFTAGSQHNEISRNAFISNQTQVKYVGTRWLEWSSEGVGNYWSDHVAFDLDKNGIADAIYRPNDLTDQIIWKYPSARLLMNSPAVQILKFAQTRFPALHPGGVVDSAPLMQIPETMTRKSAQ